MNILEIKEMLDSKQFDKVMNQMSLDELRAFHAKMIKTLVSNEIHIFKNKK